MGRTWWAEKHMKTKKLSNLAVNGLQPQKTTALGSNNPLGIGIGHYSGHGLDETGQSKNGKQPGNVFKTESVPIVASCSWLTRAE